MPKRGKGRRHSIQVSGVVSIVFLLVINTLNILSFLLIIYIKWVAGRGESILEERALWKFSSGSSDQQHQLVSPGGGNQPSLGAILEVEPNLGRSDPAEHLVRYHSTDPLVNQTTWSER